nr:hypothetical protein [Tanacetum cinerariifolium]
VAASDGVQVTSMLKRHSEEIGESSETMVTASGVADEVLAANVQVLQIYIANKYK